MNDNPYQSPAEQRERSWADVWEMIAIGVLGPPAFVSFLAALLIFTAAMWLVFFPIIVLSELVFVNHFQVGRSRQAWRLFREVLNDAWFLTVPSSAVSAYWLGELLASLIRDSAAWMPT